MISMKRTSLLSSSSSALAIAFVLASMAVTTGCGLDSVVGGTCKPGYTEAGGACVVSPSGTSPTFDPSNRQTTDTPISTNPANTTPSPVGEEPVTNPYEPIPSYEIPTLPPKEPVIENPPVDPPKELICPEPLVACHGVCISVDDDARNCGACGRICPSNICVNRECVGATPGDVVLIGHEMKSGWNGSVQAKILTNAVSIPTTDPIRVLSFEFGGDADNAASSRYLISYGIKDRTTKITLASFSELDSPNLYANYDVILMQGDGGDAAGLGARWSSTLSTFTKKGGVFVALDDGHANIPGFLTASGLLAVDSHVALPDSTHFIVSGASDVVGHQLLSPFASFGASVGFTGAATPSSDVTWVVRTQEDDSVPTVIHKVMR